MGFARRVALGSIVLVAAVRAAVYLGYAVYGLTPQFEAFHLEAKMVLLAYRVRAGLSLYPEWRSYPHVANFFGPLYFVLVGLLGRAAGADIGGLFAIGRAVTFASTVAIAAGAGAVMSRRHGRAAAATAALLCLGTPALVGFSVMVRPDMMAELLGLAGFVVSARGGRVGTLAGGALLVLAILTKQTAVVFLLAAGLALWLGGERGRAICFVAACAACLALVVLAATVVLEPNLVRSLGGESKTPWSFAAWSRTLGRAAYGSPDLFVFPAIGLVLWWRRDTLEARWAVALAVVVAASSLVLSAKRGADLNYYLSLRVVAALAAAALWQATSTAQGWVARTACVVAVLAGTASLAWSLLHMTGQALATRNDAARMQSPEGRLFLRTFQDVYRLAEDPKFRLLTDVGLFDLHCKERAAFGDPWLFRLLVETGQIEPHAMKRWIDEEAYDVIITSADIFSPEYARYDFGLPMVLVDAARVHYVPDGIRGSRFFYRRRAPR